MMADFFATALAEAQDPWRRVVARAAELGIPTPAFSSSLAYYDGYRRERGPASLIQGLRDLFGAHTYRRVDGDGAFHILWGRATAARSVPSPALSRAGPSRWARCTASVRLRTPSLRYTALECSLTVCLER